MKHYLIQSGLLHLGMLAALSIANMGLFFSPPDLKLEAMKIEFLEKPPQKKVIAQKPVSKPTDKPPKKEQDKDASPPPKPAPGIKTKASEATASNKAADKKNAAINKPQGQTVPQKSASAPPQKKAATKSQEKSPQPAKKNSHGTVKKQQEVESVDAVLNTLLPNVGGETNKDQKKIQDSNSFEMPDILEHKAVEEIRSQIEAVWNYNPTEGINFYLTIKVDPSGKILNVKLSGTDRQAALQKAAAEAAYRATLRLSKFKLKPTIFKPEHYKNGWSEIEIHFRPRS